MKKIAFFFFTFLLTSQLISQNINISGTSNAPNSIIRLFVFDDLFNWDGKIVCQTNSDSKGNFSLQAEISEISYCQIAIDLERTDILLSPNSNYEIQIECNKEEELSSYFDKMPPALIIKKATDNNLSKQIDLADKIINTFILNNFNKLYRNRRYDLLDTLSLELKNALGSIKSDYILKHIEYKTASVKLAVNRDGGKKVINEYFTTKPVLYNQTAYMELFSDLFSNHLNNSKSFNLYDLEKSFYAGYDSFQNYLKNDSLIAKGNNLSELITILSLKELFYNVAENQKTVLYYLSIIEKNSRYKENKLIANNLIKKLNYLLPNSPAPNFNLKDAEGKSHQLSDFKDQFVILNFINKNSAIYEYQLEQLKNLSDQWSKNVKIITISTKESFSENQKLFKSKEFDWTLLNLDDNIFLLEDYQIRIFPDFIIILPETKIGMAPASSPDQYLDYHLKRLMNQNN